MDKEETIQAYLNEIVRPVTRKIVKGAMEPTREVLDLEEETFDEFVDASVEVSLALTAESLNKDFNDPEIQELWAMAQTPLFKKLQDMSVKMSATERVKALSIEAAKRIPHNEIAQAVLAEYGE